MNHTDPTAAPRAVFTVTVETRPDGGHYFDQADFAGHVTQWVRSSLKGKHAIGEVTITEQPAAASAVVSPPTDRAALRDRIRLALATADGVHFDDLEPHDYQRHVDMLMAVLPEPTDRAAVLLEAAEKLAVMDPVEAALAGQHAWLDAANELRRMAVEAHGTGTQQQPARGDQFEAWLKTRRDAATGYTDAWNALDDALDRYRLHADTGTPLTEHACEGPHCDCPRATEPAPVAQQPAAADYSRSAWEAYRRDAGCACTSPDPSTCAVNHRSGPWLCVCHRLSAELTADERARLFPEQQAAAADGEETP